MIPPVIIALALPWLLGFFGVTLVLAATPGVSQRERWFLGFPLGMGMVTGQLFLIAILGIPWRLHLVGLLIVAETIALGLLAFSRCRHLLLEGSAGRAASEKPLEGDAWWLEICLRSWIGLKVVGLFWENWLSPNLGWDSVTIWGASAKAFFYEQGLLLDHPSHDFFGRGIVQRSLAYPLLNPLMQVWISLWVGSFDEFSVKMWAPCCFACIIGLLDRFTADTLPRLQRTLVLFMVASSPLMTLHARETYSDLPLACVFLAAMGCSYRVLSQNAGFLPLVGMFSAIALFTKVEGLVFVVPLVSILAILLWRQSDEGIPWRKWGMLGLSLAIASPWFIFKLWFGIPFSQESINKVFSPDFAGIWLAIKGWLSIAEFNVFPWFFPIFGLYGLIRYRSNLAPLALPVVLYVVSLSAVLIAIPDYFVHLVRGSTLFRNLLTVFPSMALLTALGLGAFLADTHPRPKD